MARSVRELRAASGWSTRTLARRAGVSQSYVVALEQGARCPTLDVVVRLAQAFGQPPSWLVDRALRPAGRHVLLVVGDHDTRSPLQHARDIALASGGNEVEWVLAAAHDDTPESPPHHHIRLHSVADAGYSPAAVADALDDALQRLSPSIAGRHLGFVFSDTSAAMARAEHPGVVVDFEHDWGPLVRHASERAAATASWNVCVYRLGDLRALPDPLATFVDLLGSHDTMWAVRDDGWTADRRAARDTLRRLRPPGVPAADWNRTTRRVIDELGLAA